MYRGTSIFPCVACLFLFLLRYLGVGAELWEDHGAFLAPKSAQSAQQSSIRSAHLCRDGAGQAQYCTGGGRECQQASFSLNATSGSPPLPCFKDRGSQHGKASTGSQLVVPQLLTLSEEERLVLLNVPKQLAAAGRIQSGLCASSKQCIMGGVAIGDALVRSSKAAPPAPKDTLKAPTEPKSPQAQGPARRSGSGLTTGSTMEATKSSSWCSPRGRCTSRYYGGEQADQGAQRSANSRSQSAIQCHGDLSKGGGREWQTGHESHAQPDHAAWPSPTTNSAVAAGQGGAASIMVRLRPSFFEGLGERCGCSREPHGSAPDIGAPSGRESSAGSTSHSRPQQGRRGNHRERGRGPLDRRPDRRHANSAGSKKAADDSTGVTKSNARHRHRGHSQTPQQGCGQEGGRRWRKWAAIGSWLSSCCACAPQLGCTSSPMWRFPAANTGAGERREQPDIMASTRKDFARQVYETCLTSGHSVVYMEDYKSPYHAQLIAEVWHLLVNLQDGPFFYGAVAMIPGLFVKNGDVMTTPAMN